MYKDSQKQFQKESSEVGLVSPQKNNKEKNKMWHWHKIDTWNKMETSKNGPQYV